jgi:hypothetical protein
MRFRVEVVCLSDGGERRCSVVEMKRDELALETLGMSVAEGKALLHGVQDFVVGQQVTDDLQYRRVCPNCGQRYSSKTAGTHTLKTVFGAVEGAQPALGALPLPDRRAADIPSGGRLAAGCAHESGVAVPGDQVGLSDSVREDCGADERGGVLSINGTENRVKNVRWLSVSAMLAR